MKLIKLLFSFCLIFMFSGVFAQEANTDTEDKKELTIGVEIRPRTEYMHGYKSPVPKYLIQDQYTYPASLSTNQRSRLNIGFNSSKVKFGLVLQDVRLWGSQAQLVGNEDFGTSVHEAWGEVFLTKNFSLKAGRMELAYDDHRILGSVGWAPQARSHDLALFKYEGAIKAHLGIAYHGGPFLGNDAYKAMQFLWINGKFGDFGYSVLALNNGLTERGFYFENPGVQMVKEKNAYSQTLGTRLTYNLGSLNFALNAYYQMGKKASNWLDVSSLPAGFTLADFNLANGTNFIDGAGQGQKIAAYNIGFEAMYKATDNFKAGIAYEALSGNNLRNPDRTEENAFTPLYGTNHKFNGWMDYFYVGNHGSDVGLQDLNLKFIANFGNVFVKVIPHYFMPARRILYTDFEGNLKTLGSLGTEIDIQLGYNIIPKVASIQVGYSHMIATESLYAVKSGVLTSGDPDSFGTNNWAWLMLTVKPNWKFSK